MTPVDIMLWISVVAKAIELASKIVAEAQQQGRDLTVAELSQIHNARKVAEQQWEDILENILKG